MRFAPFAILGISLLALASCSKDDPAPTPPVVDAGPRLILKFRFDSTQVRLNGFGGPATMPNGHAAQNPRFREMSAHYVEFAPTALTALGLGRVVYHAPETTAGGSTAIDLTQSVRVGDGQTFLNIPLSQLSAGTYEWLRVSLAYQKYDIDFRYTDTQFGTGTYDLDGTVASFIGYNTFIGSFLVAQQSVTLNANKAQGYWAFEPLAPPVSTPVVQGQAPGTTVPNPIFATSPIPAGSCVVTGPFAAPLVISGSETEDIVIIVSLSTNNSFEWQDNGDGIFEPGAPANDVVVDMGVRGMIPIVQ